MKAISTAFFGDHAALDAATIRHEVQRFAALLLDEGIDTVRVWCSYNPDLPDDSPLQSPQEIVSPERIVPFFDEAVKNSVWTYGDVWNRAGIEAKNGSFTFFLGNDRDISFGTTIASLLDRVRTSWKEAGYATREWEREHIA